MEKYTFCNYKMSQLLRIRNLSTAHYLPSLQEYNTPPHKHAAWEFVFCVKGHVSAYQGTDRKSLKANQIVMIPPNTMHCVQVDGANTTLVIISFFCADDCIKLLQNRVLHVDNSQKQILQIIVNELGNAFELEDGKLLLGSFHPSANPPLGAEQMITCYMEALLISLLRSATERETQAWNPGLLERALENRIVSEVKACIDAHLTEKLTLDSIADRIHYSRSHIASQFRKSAGTTVAHYIAKRRLEEAEKFLRSEKYTISQIAELLNYSSVQYFSKCFKDEYGCSPSAYNKRGL